MIREARPEDVERAVDLARLFWGESDAWYSRMPLNVEGFRGMLLGAIASPELLVLAYESDGEVRGGFAGAVMDFPPTGTLIATDLFLFIEPSARGGFVAAHMVKRFVEWARAQGAAGVHVGISTNIRPEGLGRLYERLGFQHVGALYSMRLVGDDGG